MPRSKQFAFSIALISIASAFSTSLGAQTVNAGTADYFESKVRPILANNCFGCHGASALGGLRLDSSEAMIKGGKRGTSLKPGDPDNSLMIQAIRQNDPALKMPQGGKLKDEDVKILEEWVKAGAVWPKSAAPVTSKVESGKYVITPERKAFWSFQPLKSEPVPAIKDVRWAKSDIDRFILARLEKDGLKPVGPASKHDLLRRATLDLIGLTPTPEEYAAFEKDTSPDAFAKVVDKLLASPHYGERWGRVWLDVARYGEDDYRSLNPNPRGYRPYPNAWAYRDWVIQAFNDDIPYDQFVKAQLAGDLMDPKVRYKMLPATGFLGLGPWYYDNGSNEVTRADERHDRVDAVTRGFMGMTVACARCHDHKYDPIPQTDYYALAGVFYNTIYEEYPQAPKKVVDEYNRMQDELDEKNKVLQEMNQGLSTELTRAFAFQTANYIEGVWDVVGAKPKKEVAAVVESRKLDYEVLERWIKYMQKPTDKYKNKDEFIAMVKKGTATPAQVKTFAERFQGEVVEAMLAKFDIDAQNKVLADKDLDGTKPKKRTDKPSNFVSNKDFNPGALIRFKSLPDEMNNFYTEVFVRELKDSDDPNAMMAAGGRQGNPGVLAFRGWGLQSRLGAEPQARIKTIQDDIDAARKKMEAYPFIHGVRDAETSANIQLALRGNPETLGPEVPRHFLSVFGDKDGNPIPFTKGSGRMELADLVLQQPITMRVIVNRIWKEHFGTGIVDSPSNFGFGGERPTNPALLEYLASSFAKNGMSIKKLQRQIMLSSVYQLSTEDNKIDSDKDSGNRLYWRANRKRLEAEQLRDSILEISGNLDQSLGGPSEELTPDYKRRTVYGKVSRYKLDSYLQLFDFPAPNISAEKRFTTTVPLQRLFLMNSDFVQIEAEALAKRVAAEPNNRARITKMYELAYGRSPSEEEINIGLDYLHTEPLKEYEENKNKPKEDTGGGGGRRGGRGGRGGGGGGQGAGAPGVISDAGAGAGGADGTVVADAAPAAGMGMMGGMGGGFAGGGGGGFGGGGRRGGAAPKADVKYEPTAWGRYAKILLGSTEFLFVN